MSKPALAADKLDQLSQEIKRSEAWRDGIPSTLWRTMLEFIYTGHPDLAWNVIDRAWPASKSGKGGFLGAFCEKLLMSSYYCDLAKSLKGHPVDCFLDE